MDVVSKKKGSWVSETLLGNIVVVCLRDNAKYQGVLASFDISKKSFNLTLKLARLLTPLKKDQEEEEGKPTIKRSSSSSSLSSSCFKMSRPIESLNISRDEFVSMSASKVLLGSGSHGDFVTDSEISSSGMSFMGSSQQRRRPKELERWKPDDNIPMSRDFELESLGGGIGERAGKKGGKKWDQFSANKRLFGVNSTYTEELYTTSLKKDSHFYRENLDKASQLAHEIESGSLPPEGKRQFNQRSLSENIHILEERGKIIEVGMDEEDRYALVYRKENENLQEPRIIIGRDHISDDDPRSSSPVPSPPPSPKALPFPQSYEFMRRLHARQIMVRERLKNSAPIFGSDFDDKKGESSSPKLRHKQPQSPLMSPLIGDPRTMSALNLDPFSPQVPWDLLQEFFSFSLSKNKSDSERGKLTSQMRSFSDEVSLSPVFSRAKTPEDQMLEETREEKGEITGSDRISRNSRKVHGNRRRATSASPVPYSHEKGSQFAPKILSPSSQRKSVNVDEFGVPRSPSSSPTITPLRPAVSPPHSTPSSPATKLSMKASPLNPHAQEFKPTTKKTSAPLSASAAPFTPPPRPPPPQASPMPQFVPQQQMFFPPVVPAGYYPPQTGPGQSPHNPYVPQLQSQPPQQPQPQLQQVPVHPGSFPMVRPFQPQAIQQYPPFQYPQMQGSPQQQLNQVPVQESPSQPQRHPIGSIPGDASQQPNPAPLRGVPNTDVLPSKGSPM